MLSLPALKDTFSAQCAKLCQENSPVVNGDHPIEALELGCGVGRSAFELARFCHRVVAQDFSSRFIQICNILKEKGQLPYNYTVEGKITRKAQAVVDSSIPRERCHFEQGDACNLRTDIGRYDTVLCANLVDRVPDPKKFLDSLPGLVKPDGVLVITTPYTWMENYTWSGKWIAGFMENDKEVKGFSVLQNILSPHFELVKKENIPMIIREHSRKFQLCIPHATVWNRK
jgi:putative 4-mercaptohistidine N1-methyltranferase